MKTNRLFLLIYNFLVYVNPYFISYLPQQFLYFLPEPQAHALLVYIVLLLLSLLLLFQSKSGSVTFSTYSIYVTIITMDILFFGNKMETLFSFVYYCNINKILMLVVF